MTRCRRALIALTAVAVVAAMPSITGERSVAEPGVPAIVIPTIPGSETARFKVIVEGKLTAVKNEDLGSAVGAGCIVSVNSVVQESTTFQRGRGVVMEFTRLGKGPRAPIIVQRPGRRLDASLALVVKTKRTSIGSASRADPPGVAVSVCDPRVEDLTQGPDCGKTLTERAKARFVYTRPQPSVGLLNLKLDPLGGLVEFDCPASEITPGIGALLFGWPGPVKFNEIRVPLSPAQIFGTKRVIVETFETGLVNAPAEVVNFSTLKGMRTNFGSTTVTVRLIRVP